MSWDPSFFDLEDAHQLQYFNHGDDSHARGSCAIMVTDSDHPYMANWWVPGCVIGCGRTFINALADFLQRLVSGEHARPNLRDALETQRVCDVVLRSAKTERWETVA